MTCSAVRFIRRGALVCAEVVFPMRTSTIAVAIVLGFALLGVVAAVPTLDAVAPVGSANAAPPCVIGQNGCVIPIYCFTDPCPEYP